MANILLAIMSVFCHQPSIGLCITNHDDRAMGYREVNLSPVLLDCIDKWTYGVPIGCPCIHGYCLVRHGVGHKLGMLPDDALGCLLCVGMRCLLDLPLRGLLLALYSSGKTL